MYYNDKKEVLCVNYIGEFIKKYRGDMSLRDFAKKCDISHTHLDSIEKGYDPRSGKPVRVTVDTLKKIANAMNMSVNDLLIQSGDVKLEDLNMELPETHKFDELEILFSKYKDILTDDDKETIKFIIEKRKKDIDKQ